MAQTDTVAENGLIDPHNIGSNCPEFSITAPAALLASSFSAMLSEVVKNA
jgi:hypothetical protein